MSSETVQARRFLIWAALLFSGLTFFVSWWHWWTFQYGTFDLAFYVQSLWLALHGKWTVSLLNVPLMGNHAEPIVFLLTPLFAICPHPMLFVAVQTLAFASMPFTAWRIGKLLKLEPKAALLLAIATVVTPATFSIGVYEFHPEALAAPLLLLMIEARLAGRYTWYWVWFIAVLGVKENMAPLLGMYCGVMAILEWWQGRMANGKSPMAESALEARSAGKMEGVGEEGRLEGTAPSVPQNARQGSDGALPSRADSIASGQPLRLQLLWNVLPAVIATVWLLIYGKVISPALNAGNVDYLQLYGHLGSSPGDILLKFFTKPYLFLSTLHGSLTLGNLLPALLLPFLLLPLLRPRWLLIAAPLLLQHLLSYRYSEWSLGAHYPAPFIALFWVAAAEALTRFRKQTLIAAVVLVACALAHFRFGPARDLIREAPGMSAMLEEREWKAQMIADIPDNASVTAGLGFLSHLAKRENIISLHHILKGLKTLSVVAYTPPPPGDVVVIDYADTLTFSTTAGYYHPWSHVDATHSIPSSDRLLNDYLSQAQWQTQSRNAVALLRRGGPGALQAVPGKPLKIDDATTLESMHFTKQLPGGWQVRMTWNFIGERRRFPWLMLVFSDGKKLYPIVKGMCAPAATTGQYTEQWDVIFPNWMPAGQYAVFAEFYDNSNAAWYKKQPPDDQSFMLNLINVGTAEVKPGVFQ